MIRWLPAAALSVALMAGGCSSALNWGGDVPASRRADVHVVRAGDTLHSIAWRYRLDARRLAAWNRLGDGNLIFPGQKIRLSPPPRAAGARERPHQPAAAAPAAKVPWRWPVPGPVIAAWGATPDTASGIQLGGRRGEPVRAAADGVVVYAGSGLAGYGQLLIIKHSDVWLSAYGHNEKLLVGEGAAVRAGQQVAALGLGKGQRPMLHFEIRRDGKPVDPLRQLPAR